MFKKFLELNKGKIKFGLWFGSLFCTTIVLITLAWATRSGDIAENLFFSIIITAAIIFPIFVMGLGTLTGYLEFKRTNEILNNYPINELTRHGLELVIKNEKTKWELSQIMLRGYFNDYPVDCEIEEGLLKFTALVNRDDFKKENMDKLKKEFGKKKVQYNWLGISLCYTKKERPTAYEQLKSELEQFINFFKKEGLRPWDKPWE